MFDSYFNLDPDVQLCHVPRRKGTKGSEASGEGDAFGAVGARSSAEVAPAHARGGGSVLQHQETER